MELHGKFSRIRQGIAFKEMPQQFAAKKPDWAAWAVIALFTLLVKVLFNF
jgi:hypothetical protein